MKHSVKLLAGWLLLFTGSLVYAHHSAVVFDENLTINKMGVVTKFILRNPHMIITLDVTDDSGEVVTWNLEGQSIAAMQVMGFDRESIAVGDTVTIKMYPLKSGQPGGLVTGDGAFHAIIAPATKLAPHAGHTVRITGMLKEGVIMATKAEMSVNGSYTEFNIKGMM